MIRVSLLLLLLAFSTVAKVKTDTLAAKSNIIQVKDTSNFLKGVSFSGGDLLSVYDTGSFACTLKTSQFTAQQITRAKYTNIGNIVFITIPAISGTSNNAGLLVFCTIPASIKPTYVRDGWCTVTDNGVAKPGYWLINFVSGTYITFYQNSGSFTTSGTKGIGDATLTGSEVTLQYIKN